MLVVQRTDDAPDSIVGALHHKL